MGKRTEQKPLEAGLGSLADIGTLIKAAGPGRASIEIVLDSVPPSKAVELYDIAAKHCGAKCDLKKHSLRTFEMPSSKHFRVETRIGKIRVAVTVGVTDQDFYSWRAMV